MLRRDFLKLSAAGALVVCSPSFISTELRADDGRLYKTYNRVLLTDADGNPLTQSQMKKEKAYIFNYPFVATPVMLLDLQKQPKGNIELKSESGETYVWKGGTGTGNTLVAYSAICSHQLTHPNPVDSFVTYSGENKTMACNKKCVIVCGSHLSAFDPKEGAKPVAGPAKEPLTSIILEVDEQDQIWAVGVLGPDKYHDFFKSFKDEFKEFYGNRRKAKKQVQEAAIAKLLPEYSAEVVPL
jgi:arsenite oxidase small subunit